MFLTILQTLLSLPLPTIAITVLFAILFSLAICFSSYPLYRVYLFTMGFLSGFTFLLTWNSIHIDLTNPYKVVLAVGFGIVIGRLACVLFRLGVALPGAVLGLFVSYLLLQGFGISFILAYGLLFVFLCAGSIRQLSYLPGDPYLAPRVNPPPDSQPMP